MTTYVCNNCCDENCKKMGLTEDQWEPFQILCGEDCDHGKLTKDMFDHRYNGLWYDLHEFAQEIGENCHGVALDKLPSYIKNSIDWGNVWETLSVYYNVYNNYVFRIL
jgi:hypothetical protein